MKTNTPIFILLFAGLQLGPVWSTAEELEELILEISTIQVEGGNSKLGEHDQRLLDDGSKGQISLDAFYRNGLDSRYLNYDYNQLQAGVKRQGNVAIDARWLRIDRVDVANALTPLRGSVSLSLPAGFDAPADAADLTFYHSTDVNVSRNIYELNLRAFQGPLHGHMDYQRHDRDGRLLTGGGQGFFGTAILLEPINYFVDDLTFGVDYHEDQWSLGADYRLSRFRNYNDQLTFANPLFDGLDVQQLALYPGNDLHQVSTDGYYRFSGPHQISWYLALSHTKQDDALLPYTNDTVGFYAPTNPLPINSANAEVKHTYFQFNFVSRPTAPLTLRAEYRLRQKDDTRRPMAFDMLSFNGGVTPLGSSTHIYDRTQHLLSLESGWRTRRWGRISIGYQQELSERSTDKLDEHYRDDSQQRDIEFKWSPPRWQRIKSSISTTYSDKNADLSRSWREELQPAGASDPDGALPLFLAGFERWRHHLRLDIPLTNQLQLTGTFELNQEDFDNPWLGIKERDYYSMAMTVAASLRDNLQLSIFAYTAQFQTLQAGRETGGGFSAIWQIDHQDNNQSFGASLSWQPQPTVNVDLKLNHHHSSSEYASRWEEILIPDPARDLSPSQLPPTAYNRDELTLRMDWQFRPKNSLWVSYRYRLDEIRYWAYDSSTAATLGFAWTELGQLEGNLIAAGIKFDLLP